jgi:Fe-S-cluster containining protein
MECTQCGACCIAPDIAALDKPLGQRCPHLTEALLCGVYERRPAVCRSYAADAFCEEIAAPSIEARVHNYLAAFGLLEEAAAVASALGSGRHGQQGLRSLGGLRPLPVLAPSSGTAEVVR